MSSHTSGSKFMVEIVRCLEHNFVTCGGNSQNHVHEPHVIACCHHDAVLPVDLNLVEVLQFFCDRRSARGRSLEQVCTDDLPERREIEAAAPLLLVVVHHR